MKQARKDEGGAFPPTAGDDGVPSLALSLEKTRRDAAAARVTLAEISLRKSFESDEERNQALVTVLRSLGIERR